MKRKFTIYNVQFTIFVLIFTFYILHFTFYISTAEAVDSTPSADIKSKLEELKKEIASRAAQFKDAVDRQLKDKAYIGSIKSKSDTTLTLSTQSGPKIININQDTILPKKMKSEDYVAALGDSDEIGVLTAKKIILLNPSPYTLNPKTFLWGQIISISGELATLKTNDFKNVAISLPVNAETKLNDFVILTGRKNKNNVFEAGFVYVIPQGGIIRPKKIATPSAKIATPSSKPKR